MVLRLSCQARKQTCAAPELWFILFFFFFLPPPCGGTPSVIKWKHCGTQRISEGGKGDAGHLEKEEGPWRTKPEHGHTLLEAHVSRVYVCLLQGSTLGTSLFIKRDTFFHLSVWCMWGSKKERCVGWGSGCDHCCQRSQFKKKKDAPVGY